MVGCFGRKAGYTRSVLLSTPVCKSFCSGFAVIVVDDGDGSGAYVF